MYSNYADIDGVTERLLKLAPRLGADRARFLADNWCDKNEQGHYSLKHDPAHKRVNSVLYRRQEAVSCWREITAKVLLVLAKESSFYSRYQSEGFQTELNENILNLQEAFIDSSGHMVHLEQPASLASVLGKFLIS